MSTESLLKAPLDDLPDELEYSTSNASNLEDAQHYLIFFISGNPGLITYYTPFLAKLRELLASNDSSDACFHICGHSYGGFEISPQTAKKDEPLGLDEQIEYQEDQLMTYAKKYQTPSKRSLKVILVGHSVGSYVLLELIQRHLHAVEQSSEVEDFDLIGGILLFPTIAEIGQSPVGRLARLVLPLPGFARIMGTLAQGLTYMLPSTVVTRLVRLITRFPDYAVKTTMALLQSPLGVRQAL